MNFRMIEPFHMICMKSKHFMTAFPNIIKSRFCAGADCNAAPWCYDVDLNEKKIQLRVGFFRNEAVVHIVQILH